MTVIIDIDHETNDLSQYTSYVDDSGDMTVQAGAALAGTSYGLQCIIDDTGYMWGIKTLGTPNTSGIYRFRFYYDINGLASTAVDIINMLYLYNSSSDTIGRINTYTPGDSTWNLQVTLYDDGGTQRQSSWYSIDDSPHIVEILLVRATTDSSADGYATLWIDEAEQGGTGNYDNYDRMVNFNEMSLGMSGIAATTTGTVYIDEIVMNDDGGVIGPVSTDLSASTSDGLTLGESMQSVASLGNIDVALDNANYQGRGVRII